MNKELATIHTTSARLVAAALGRGHSDIRSELGPAEVAIATHSIGGRYIEYAEGAFVRRVPDEVFGSGHFDVFDLTKAKPGAYLELVSATSGTEVRAYLGHDGVWKVSINAPDGYRGHYWKVFVKALSLGYQ